MQVEAPYFCCSAAQSRKRALLALREADADRFVRNAAIPVARLKINVPLHQLQGPQGWGHVRRQMMKGLT